MSLGLKKMTVRICFFSSTQPVFWRIGVAAWRKFLHWDFRLLVAQLEGNSEAQSGKSISECDNSIVSSISLLTDLMFSL